MHGGSTQLFWWSLAILGSSALWAWASWSAPSMPAPASGPAATFYQLCIGGAVLVVVGLLLGERLVLAEVTGRSALALVYLVVIGSLVAWTAFTWVLRNVPVSLGATYAYVNPVVAVLLGVLFYGEVFSLDVVIGCTVVLGGVALVVSGESAGLRSRRSSRNDAQAPTVSTMDARST